MRFTICALVVCVLATNVVAQARPNFSGNWVLDRQRSTQTLKDKRVTAVTGLLGETFTAKQTEKTLTLEIAIPVQRLNVTAVYNLDGTESRNMNPVGPGLPDEPVFSKASWDGARLVIHTRGTAQGNAPPLETKREIWIDTDGQLVIERSAEGQPTTRSVYRRATAGARRYLPALL